MMEATLELGAATQCVFVTCDQALATEIEERFLGALIVGEPDVLVAALNRLSTN